MCTSISFSRPALYGRNLDLDVSFGEQIAIAPRELPFHFHHNASLERHFAMVGMANIAGEVPLFAEAVNEKGLYMAGLNFPGYAHYFPDTVCEMKRIAPYELIPLVLGTCSTAAEARQLLENIRLTAIPFAPGYPLAPLHWHIADQTTSFVAEPMQDGLRIYENPVGVLTNNPPFPFHMMNLNNFQMLSPHQPENHFSSKLELHPYGQGMGAMGLPGDSSPMSRFVRTAFLKMNAVFTEDCGENVTQFFHILDAAAMVRGTVVTPENRYDETIYSCCIDAEKLIYYYKTYESGRICAVRLTEEACCGSELRVFSLERTPIFHFLDNN